jgi:gluconate 2-dehydrogenase gamma chain
MAADNPFSPRNPSRRAFLHASGNVLGGSWLAMQLPGLLAVAQAASAAIEQGASLRNLDPAEAAALEAIAARIIPSDDTPGAREAGVIHFIDQALDEFMADASAELRAGIDSVDALAADAVDGRRFAQLGPEDQDAILQGIEETPFFGLMHFLTVAGMFALPAYGGNRNHLGWKLLGFDHRHGWQPPFGHYDAELMGAPPPAAAHGAEHEHD